VPLREIKAASVAGTSAKRVLGLEQAGNDSKIVEIVDSAEKPPIHENLL
jgi:hypothetical protein